MNFWSSIIELLFPPNLKDNISAIIEIAISSGVLAPIPNPTGALANNAYRHYQAIEFARKAEKYDLFWFEAPVEPDDYIGQAEITRSTSIPIAAGENEYTRYGFRDMINHRAVDILQPDCLILGGVTEFMKVCALAQSNDLDIAPHGAQEVHIHLVSAIPNGLI